MTERNQSRKSDLHLFAGLLVPSIVTFGQPGGVFYNWDPRFSLTGIVSPLYNFMFSGFSGENSLFKFIEFQSHFPRSFDSFVPLVILNTLSFILGVSQILALKAFEMKRINLRVFLVPILVYVAISILFFGSFLPSIQYGYHGHLDYFAILSEFTGVCYVLPTLTIGVLVKAYGIKTFNR